MATLNSIGCDAIIKNTGISACAFNPQVITGLIFIPKGRTFTAAEIADWKNTLINAANADNKAERIYPVGQFVALTDNSEDTVRETLGYGGEYKVREGQYRWMFRFMNGGMCFNTALWSFDGQQDRFDVLLVDKQNAVIGTVYVDPDTEAEELAGLTIGEIDKQKLQLSDGSTATQYWIRITLADESELNQRPGIVLEQDNPFSILKTVRGLIDVSLKNITPIGAPAGVKRVALLAGCGSENLVDIYESELEDPALFIATNSGTGLPLTITSVDVLPGIGLEFTFNTGTNYPVAPDKIVLTGVSPSALAAADIESPEGNRYDFGEVRLPAASPTT